MRSTIISELTDVYADFFVGTMGLAQHPEYEEDVHRYAAGVRNRARDGALPQLQSMWPRFDFLVESLLGDIVQNGRRTTDFPHKGLMSDREPAPGCQSCENPFRTKQLARLAGETLAESLDAIIRSDSGRLRSALQRLPSDLDEGHGLSFLVIRNAFKQRATLLGLPDSLKRRIGSILNQLEDGVEVQLHFAFAA